AKRASPIPRGEECANGARVDSDSDETGGRCRVDPGEHWRVEEDHGLSLQTVARRYATALADVAIARREEKVVQSELDQWSTMIESSPQLKEVFANPTIIYDHKRKVLEDLIVRSRSRDTTSSFLRVLLKNQRLAQLRDIA